MVKFFDYNQDIKWSDTVGLLVAAAVFHIIRISFLQLVVVIRKWALNAEELKAKKNFRDGGDDSSLPGDDQLELSAGEALRVSVHRRLRYRGSAFTSSIVEKLTKWTFALMHFAVVKMHLSWTLMVLLSCVLNILVVTCFFVDLERYRMDIGTGIIVFVCAIIISCGTMISLLIEPQLDSSLVSRMLDADNLVDSLTIPSLFASGLGLVSYLNFNYLRIHYLFRTFRYLVFGPDVDRPSDQVQNLTAYLVSFGVEMFSLIVILATSMIELERLGEATGSGQFRDTAGNVPYNVVTSYYFIVVTIATVGYGDMAPDTYLGRVLVILILGGFLYFVAVKLGEVVAVFGSNNVGEKAYRSDALRTHVVITGKIRNESLTAFLNSFYSDPANDFTNVVIFADSLSMGSSDWYAILDNDFARSHVTYVRGDPLNLGDFTKAQISRAKAIFVFSQCDVGDPMDQDIRNSGFVALVRSVAPSTPIIMQYNRREISHICETALFAATEKVYREQKSTDFAAAAHEDGFDYHKFIPFAQWKLSCLPRKEEDEDSKAVNVKGCGELLCSTDTLMHFTAQSILIPGISSLIMDCLFEKRKPAFYIKERIMAESEKALTGLPPWQCEVEEGVKTSFHIWVIPSQLTGLTYAEIVMQAFIGLRIVILGEFLHDFAEVDEYGSRIQPIDLSKKIQDNSVVLILINRDEKEHYESRVAGFLAALKRDDNSTPRTNKKQRSEDERSGILLPSFRDERKTEATEQFQGKVATRKATRKQSADLDLASLKGHIVFCVRDALDFPTLQRLMELMKQKIIGIQANDLPYEVAGIVVLVPEINDFQKDLLKSVYSKTIIIEGSADELSDMERCNFGSASSLVVLGSTLEENVSSGGVFLDTLNEKNTFRSCSLINAELLTPQPSNMFILSMYSNMRELSSVREAIARRLNIRQGITAQKTVEWAKSDESSMDISNIKFATEVSASKVKWQDALELLLPSRAGKDQPESSLDYGDAADLASFASGEIVPSGLLSALLCREFQIPGLIDFLGFVTGSKLVNNRSLALSLTVPQQYDGKFYSDLVETLFAFGMIPMGLYRSGKAPVCVRSEEPSSDNLAIKESAKNLLPYTMVNPSPDTILSSYDAVFVLRVSAENRPISDLYSDDSELSNPSLWADPSIAAPVNKVPVSNEPTSPEEQHRARPVVTFDNPVATEEITAARFEDNNSSEVSITIVPLAEQTSQDVSGPQPVQVPVTSALEQLLEQPHRAENQHSANLQVSQESGPEISSALLAASPSQEPELRSHGDDRDGAEAYVSQEALDGSQS